MGALLVVAFIATILLVCGLIVMFIGRNSGDKQPGMYMVVIAIILGVLCMIFQPKSEYIQTSIWSNSY